MLNIYRTYIARCIKCIFKKILQNLHIFDELIIYFVSYMLSIVKRGREKSENSESVLPSDFYTTAIYDEKFPAQK